MPSWRVTRLFGVIVVAAFAISFGAPVCSVAVASSSASPAVVEVARLRIVTFGRRLDPRAPIAVITVGDTVSGYRADRVWSGKGATATVFAATRLSDLRARSR